MPNPIDILFNPVAYICYTIFAALMLWEYLLPARRLPRSPWWQLRGLCAFVVYFLVSSYLPLLWDSTLAAFKLFDLSAQPVLLQAAAGLVTFEFLVYWWHRTMHHNDWLWRMFHQMHHSAERLDTFGAFWFSPLDMAGFTLVSSLALTLVLGVNVEAATLVIYATFFLGIFQHANIHTPRWLGYFVQRPESHSRHHGHGLHRDNYADLPVFDLIFGTFNNPERHRDNGFYHGASLRVGEMLLWKDVSLPAPGQPNATATLSAVP